MVSVPTCMENASSEPRVKKKRELPGHCLNILLITNGVFSEVELFLALIEPVRCQFLSWTAIIMKT